MSHYTLYQQDLPKDLVLKGDLAIDTETLGLNVLRDRLCLIQISDGDGHAHIVQFDGKDYSAPNLKALLTDPKRTKIIHYARFDIAVIRQYLGVELTPVYCTKIASKLVRTYTDKHGLKDLCKELVSVDLSKLMQSSDWSAKKLSHEQLEYAASDVLYLHKMRDTLDRMLADTGRVEIAAACFAFLKTRVSLDLLGWDEADIFQHS